MEVRCDNGILFGIIDEGFIEVKCRSRRCGSEPGVVVIHRFSTSDGSLLKTLVFRDPTPIERQVD